MGNGLVGRVGFPGRARPLVARHMRTDLGQLKQRLDAQYASFNHAESASDPIQIVRRFKSPADREIVGFCAAALAFGRVTSVLQSIERLVVLMGPSPTASISASGRRFRRRS